MLRTYFPPWLKSSPVEFSLELVSAVALGFAVVNYLF